MTFDPCEPVATIGPGRRPRRMFARIGLVVAFAATSLVGVQTVGIADVAAAPSPASAYSALAPTRILDTRIAVGAPSRVRAGNSIDLQVAGANGVPPNATAVVLNLTATDPAAAGFVTAWPTGTTRPTTSVINYERAGQTIANLVTVPVGAGGAVSLYTLAEVDLIADVSGFYVASGPTRGGRLVSTAPTRVLDTRTGSGLVGGGQTISVDLAPFGVPADATAAVVKVTVTEAANPGFWTVFAAGATRPQASNVNVDFVGQTIPNQVITPLSAARFSVFAQTGGHLIVDLVGWYTGASAAVDQAGLFIAIDPFRLLDTRDPANGPGVAARAQQKVEVNIAGRGGIPATGVGSVLINATVTGTAAPGFFSVWPARTYRPLVSSLNADAAGQTIANHVITPVTAGGFDFFTQNGADLLADVTGWFIGVPGLTVLPPAVPLPPAGGPPELGNYLYQYASYPGGYGTTRAGPEDQPFRWNPCAPIRYVINLNGYAESLRTMIHEAVDRVSTASGLTFVEVGNTAHVPTSADPWGVPRSTATTRSGPYDMIISLANPDISDLIGGSITGRAAPLVTYRAGKVGQFVIASVVVDMTDAVGAPDWAPIGRGPVLLHELAHAVGLDHVPDRAQIMFNTSSSSGPTTFAAGDLRGLWQVGAARGCDNF